MASNDLVVRISAKNAASPVVQRLVRDLQGAGAKIKGAERNLAGLNRETRGLKDFSRGVVVPRLAQGFRSLGKDAHSAFRSAGLLGSALSALSDIPGLGDALKVATVFTVGAAAAAKHWATVGLNTGIAARNIGITTGALYRYQAIGRMAGVSTGAMTSGLQGFATALAKARINKDPAAMVALHMLGINPGTGANAKPISVLLPQVLSAVAKIKNGPMQLQVLNALGLGAGMAPLARMGGAWFSRETAYWRGQGINSNLFMGSRKLYSDVSKLETSLSILSDHIGKLASGPIDDLVRALTWGTQKLTRLFGLHLHLPSLHPHSLVPLHPLSNIPTIRLGGSAAGANSHWLGGGSAPRGLRNNNPLNLSYVKGQKGLVGRDGQFGRFGTLQEGIAAEARQINLYRARGLNTIAGIVGTWDKGDPNRYSYEAYVANRLGISPYAKLPNTPAMNRRLIAAMGRFETGRELPLPAVRAGVAAANGRVTVDINHNGAPPGTSSRTTTSGDGVALGTVRIAHAMPGIS